MRTLKQRRAKPWRMRALVLAVVAALLSGCVLGPERAPGTTARATDALGTTFLVLVEDAFSLAGPAGARALASSGPACVNATYDAGQLTLLQNGRDPPAPLTLLRVVPGDSLHDPHVLTETDPRTNDHAADASFPPLGDETNVRSALPSGPLFARLRLAPGAPWIATNAPPVEGRNESAAGGERRLDPGEVLQWAEDFDVPSEGGTLRAHERVVLTNVGNVTVRAADPTGGCFDVDRCAPGAPREVARESWEARVAPSEGGRVVARLPAPAAPARPERFVGEKEGMPTMAEWLANATVEGRASLSIERTERGAALRVEAVGAAVVRSHVEGGWRRATCTGEGYLSAAWSMGGERSGVAWVDAPAAVDVGFVGVSSACGRSASLHANATAAGWVDLVGQDGGVCS